MAVLGDHTALFKHSYQAAFHLSVPEVLHVSAYKQNIGKIQRGVTPYPGVENAQFCQSLHHLLVVNVPCVVTIIPPAKQSMQLSWVSLSPHRMTMWELARTQKLARARCSCLTVSQICVCI